MPDAKPTSTMLQDPPDPNAVLDADDEAGDDGKDADAGKGKDAEKEAKGGHGAAEKEGKDTKSGKEHGPSSDHPRFKEIYGKLKGVEDRLEDTGRKLKERDEDVDLMRQHNQRLQAAIDKAVEVKSGDDDGVPPNPVEDPEAYTKYWAGLRAKDKKAFELKLAQDTAATRFNTQLDMQKELHEDYEDTVKPVMRLIEKDQKVKDEIYGASNPPRAAYQYGLKLKKEQSGGKDDAKDDAEKKRAEAERKRAVDQGRVDGGDRGGGEGGDETEELSAEEKRVAKLMNVTTAQYLKQKKQIAK